MRQKTQDILFQIFPTPSHLTPLSQGSRPKASSLPKPPERGRKIGRVMGRASESYVTRRNARCQAEGRPPSLHIIAAAIFSPLLRICTCKNSLYLYLALAGARNQSGFTVAASTARTHSSRFRQALRGRAIVGTSFTRSDVIVREIPIPVAR